MTTNFILVNMQNTTPSRYPSRGTDDRRAMFEILDEGLFTTVSFIRNGVPHQIPTGYCRVGEEIFIHASSKSYFMDAIIGQQVSFSVTHMDALVLAPTAFDSSFNYRSVIGFARGVEITDEQEKTKFFKLFTDRYMPGRIADVGEPTSQQVSITKIVRLSLENAAAKVRSGDVNMNIKEQDTWCGVIPYESNFGIPEKDDQLPADLKTPKYINNLINGSSAA